MCAHIMEISLSTHLIGDQVWMHFYVFQQKT